VRRDILYVRIATGKRQVFSAALVNIVLCVRNLYVRAFLKREMVRSNTNHGKSKGISCLFYGFIKDEIEKRVML
jgi:hypothetical protein